MLVVEGLRKTYGDVVALDDVDLTIEAGEILGLLGPNGAGKTTLVSIITGLRRPDAGRVTVGGVDALAPGSRARDWIGLAPQELGVYPTCTTHENLMIFGRLADLRGRELTRRVAEAADLLGLGSLMPKQVRYLSGGEKRRLHTAIALLHRPRLLLLDEPTVGVDVRSRSELLAGIRRFADQEIAVCYSTHFLPEVEALGASVCIIDGGRIIVRDELDNLLRSHGISALEVTFTSGSRPLLDIEAEWSDNRCRIISSRPEDELTRLLSVLGGDAGLIQSVEFVRPSLETVFLSLTGRRYSSYTSNEELPDANPS